MPTGQGCRLQAEIETRCEGRFEVPALAEVEKKLQSLLDGLTQAEAQKRLAQ
jgi:hypothetical protein